MQQIAIMKINHFFEYHYYRVAKFFFKRDGTNALSALLSVSSVEFWIILNILIFFESLLFEHHKRKLFLYEKVFIFILFSAVIYYNYRKHHKQYLKYRERWKDEPKKKSVLNGIIVILTLLISWGLIFINALIFGRFIK